MPDDSSDDSSQRSWQVAFDVNLRISHVKFNSIGMYRSFSCLAASLRAYFTRVLPLTHATCASHELCLVPVRAHGNFDILNNNDSRN